MRRPNEKRAQFPSHGKARTRPPRARSNLGGSRREDGRLLDEDEDEVYDFDAQGEEEQQQIHYVDDASTREGTEMVPLSGRPSRPGYSR